MEKAKSSFLPSCLLLLLDFAVPIVGPAIAVFIALSNKSKYRVAPVVCCSVTLAALQGLLVFAVVMRSFFVASFYIPSDSMSPTLMTGDMILVDKACYRLGGEIPQRGEIVVFDNPLNRKQQYIKRVVGLPGDTVELGDGTLYINGSDYPEPYVAEPSHRDFGPATVPAGKYFILTDNRNQGLDSRVWGSVPLDYIKGRMKRVLWRSRAGGAAATGRPASGP
jgi:signal peptidase I